MTTTTTEKAEMDETNHSKQTRGEAWHGKYYCGKKGRRIEGVKARGHVIDCPVGVTKTHLPSRPRSEMCLLFFLLSVTLRGRGGGNEGGESVRLQTYTEWNVQ